MNRRPYRRRRKEWSRPMAALDGGYFIKSHKTGETLTFNDRVAAWKAYYHLVGGIA